MDSSMTHIAVATISVVVFSALWFLSSRRIPAFLNKSRCSIPLIEKIQLSHDTMLFRFGLPDGHSLGLPIAKHIKVYAPNKKGVKEVEWNGREDPESGKPEIERKYTPVSSDADVGKVDLVIKVYKGGVIDRFPDGGKMSQYLDSLKIGQHLDIMGPVGLHEYKGNGTFVIKRKDRTFKNVGMIAGGTGLTPMLQIIQAVLKNKNDKTKLWLLYANQTEEDILLRDTLESLAEEHSRRFQLHYTVDRANTVWNYSTGFIDEEMVKNHLPSPGDDTLVLMCGPPPMINFACRPNLEKVGHRKENQVDF